MFEFIEDLPEIEKDHIMELYIDDMIDFFQRTFNVLAVSYAHAILLEPDMMERQASPVRESLTILDSSMDDLKNMKDNWERSKTMKNQKE